MDILLRFKIGDVKNIFMICTFQSLVCDLKDNEKALIIRTLKKCNGRRKDAAKELGFSERTLYRKIRDYGLD